MDQKVLADRVVAAQAGSLKDFSVLVRQFQDMAVGYGQVLLKDYQLAEDAAQDAFVQAYMHLGQIQKPEAFPGWFRQIVFSCCMRYCKRRREVIVPEETIHTFVDRQPLPDEKLANKERSRLFHAALDVLSEDERAALFLYYIREQTQKDMADFLGVSVTTVKKRLQSARHKLHRRLLVMVRQKVEETAPSRDKKFTRKVLVRVEAAHNDSTVVGALHGMLNAAGTKWSVARVAGTFGHAFSFCMKEGCEDVWQAAVLDWDAFFSLLPRTGYRFQCFQAILANPQIKAPTQRELDKIKKETWLAVCKSIDKGIPAMAWSPLTVEQKKNGLHAPEWGLLVGYDVSDKTYTVRHQRNGNREFKVPFDQFGYTDPVNWYCVLTLGEQLSFDRSAVAAATLRDALKFADGTRFDRNKMSYHIDALGFGAYEFWRDSLTLGTTSVQFPRGHASALKGLRTSAGLYVRECMDLFSEDVAQELNCAAACYEMEVAALQKLQNLCEEAFENDGFSESQRQDSVATLTAALHAERLAVGHIEKALGLIGDIELPDEIMPEKK